MDGSRFLLGCDLAKAMDFTSFAVIKMDYDQFLCDFKYNLVALDRIKGVEYPKITELIVSTMKRLINEGRDITDGPHLCMDASGLGAPIRDYLKQYTVFGGGIHGRKIYPVVFTGGQAARLDPITHNYNISKSIIVGNFQGLMQSRRFGYAPDLAALPQLEREIGAFKYHQTSSGHTSFDAEVGEHDDLICAICIPLIIGEWQYRRRMPPKG
jgi:hypothetical protein